MEKTKMNKMRFKMGSVVTHCMCWTYFLYAKFLSVEVCLQREDGSGSEALVRTLNIQRSCEIPTAGSSALEQLCPNLIKKTGNKHKVTQKIKSVEYCVKGSNTK